jgi:hypothetical protein
MTVFNLTRRRKYGYYQKGVYPPEFNDTFKKRIRKRDKYLCAVCAKKRRLDVHHIDYTKRTVPENCISLCRDCHKLIHTCSYAVKQIWRMKLSVIAGERERDLNAYQS